MDTFSNYIIIFLAVMTSQEVSYLAGKIERFSYDFEIKTREQNRNNKRTEKEQFDWFIQQIQTHVPVGWLIERSGKNTS